MEVFLVNIPVLVYNISSKRGSSNMTQYKKLFGIIRLVEPKNHETLNKEATNGFKRVVIGN